ncbi:DUF2513 domain-containing protein [Bacillus glycinifermentans]|uniref:DUF2513 domain-containing protein n=1 Tax=Bacillus glycinifermentans TaxID=1664069 RepID=UPI001C2307F6|nr:DUF2513 domain-containing protein [Bacillus glycinifermentans]MBU8785450.1 DUF2513 domain-containing protein [Bacillus glycinifermentans]
MRLDHDCVRELLLELEEKLTLNDQLNISEIRELQTFEKFGEETTFYAILKLIDANFIQGKALRADSYLIHGLLIRSLTWDGHIFLDNIREPSVWKATKEKTKGLASISVTLMAGIAQDYLKQKLGLN